MHWVKLQLLICALLLYPLVSIHCFAHEGNMIPTSKWSGADPGPYGPQLGCDGLKIKTSVSAKDRLGQSGGASSKMIFECEQHPWVKQKQFLYP